MACTERVPGEIRYAIVDQISDLSSFQQLVQASPSFKKLFDSKPKYFLRTLLSRTMHQDLEAEALSALQSSMMLHTGDVRMVKTIQFLKEKYPKEPVEAKIVPLIPKNIDIAALMSIYNLHATVQFLTADFCAYIQENQAIHHHKYPQMRFSTPLSESETLRIHRALYRVQIFGNLYREKRFQSPWIQEERRDFCHKIERRNEWMNDYDCPRSDQGAEDPNPFTDSFNAWENEEIACIRDYMHDRLAKCFAKVADDYAEVVNEKNKLPPDGSDLFWDLDLSRGKFEQSSKLTY
jgi:hypothetical protein